MSKMVNAIANDINCCIADTPMQILHTTTIAAGVTAVAAKTYFRKAEIFGLKDLAGTNNTGTVNLGWSNSASAQPIKITAGASKVFEAPLGTKWDLSLLFFTVANDGDGVVVIYT